MDNTKRYYANVELSCVEYFEENIKERSDKIKIVTKDETIKTSEDGTQYIYYVLEAEEGIIDPKWTLES